MRVFTILIILAYVNVSAQTIPYGKWIFEDLGDTTTIDVDGLEFGRIFFESFYITLQDNSLYQISILNRISNGYIEVEACSDSMIHLISEDQEELKIQILEKSKNSLRVKIKDKMDFRLKKASYSDTIQIKDLRNKPEGVELNPAFLTDKKWHYIHTSESKNEDIANAVEAIVQEGYIMYGSDGTFEQHLLGIELEGTWEISNNKTSITTTTEDFTQLWFVQELNENTLKLLIPHSRKIIELKSN